MHAEGLGDLRRGLALIGKTGDQGDLLGAELGRSAEFHAARHRRLAPRSRALPNEGTLELGDAAEHGQDHLAGGRSRVGPWRSLGINLDDADFTDAQAIASIARLTGGNFRLLHRLFVQIERIMKINELAVITDDVVEAARSTLVIGAN